MFCYFMNHKDLLISQTNTKSCPRHDILFLGFISYSNCFVSKVSRNHRCFWVSPSSLSAPKKGQPESRLNWPDHPTRQNLILALYSIHSNKQHIRNNTQTAVIKQHIKCRRTVKSGMALCETFNEGYSLLVTIMWLGNIIAPIEKFISYDTRKGLSFLCKKTFSPLTKKLKTKICPSHSPMWLWQWSYRSYSSSAMNRYQQISAFEWKTEHFQYKVRVRTLISPLEL